MFFIPLACFCFNRKHFALIYRYQHHIHKFKWGWRYLSREICGFNLFSGVHTSFQFSLIYPCAHRSPPIFIILSNIPEKTSWKTCEWEKTIKLTNKLQMILQHPKISHLFIYLFSRFIIVSTRAPQNQLTPCKNNF